MSDLEADLAQQMAERECPQNCDCDLEAGEGCFDLKVVVALRKLMQENEGLRDEIERLRGTLRCQRCGSSGDTIILCAGCQQPLAGLNK